ncbi:MAG: oligoribonuclease [Gammaproteobacteria bacterium]|nr:oligoribonuclease [Gammaproteobacteria bacterium]MDE2344831.1 oligoribonuclease [Gammaproteobacteria bacterium]
MAINAENLVWLDLEMTGLDPDSDRILEIATLVTDKHLNLLAEGPVMAVHQSTEILSAMGEWCTHQHQQSGLTQRVAGSQTSEAAAQRITLDFLRQYLPPKTSPMCGNSICQDRRFLAHYMPELEQFFHYRNLDVSTLKELAKRWAPEVINGFTKQSSHLALDDIRDSVAELKYYREHLFKASI